MSNKRPPRASQPATPGPRALPEVLRVRVAFADTDAMGVAWHGNYLRWFEMGRTELMRPTELPYPALVGRGIHLPVIEALVRYRKPARYDDLLIVRIGRIRAGGVRLRIDYRIECDAALIVDGHTEHAFTDAAGRVVRPPRDVQEIFARLSAAHGG
ncbi:MAG: acyl-CoA thioesterase [Candidatus Methylomirabilia bacterium]